MFSKELEQSIASLFDQAQDKNIQYITIEHLLLMILNDFDVADALESFNVSRDQLRSSTEDYLADTTILKVDEAKPVQPTLGFQRVLQRAVFHIQSSGKGVVKPINILVAIFSEKESHAVFLLSKIGVSRLDIVSYISHGSNSSKEDTSSLNKNEEAEISEETPKSDTNEFLINLNNLALENKIEKLIGRENEIARMIQILARRTKNNPLLVGESGVGKTAIAEGVALQIVLKQVPEILHESIVYSLDTVSYTHLTLPTIYSV